MSRFDQNWDNESLATLFDLNPDLLVGIKIWANQWTGTIYNGVYGKLCRCIYVWFVTEENNKDISVCIKNCGLHTNYRITLVEVLDGKD